MPFHFLKKRSCMKILFAEDNPDIREFYCSLFFETIPGIQIIEVDNGKNGIAELLKRNNSFDLVITDYFMPNGHGDLICNYLYKTGSNIPFIYLTARPYEEIMTKTSFFPMRKGLDYYLKKSGNVSNFHYKMHDICLNIITYYKEKNLSGPDGFQQISEYFLQTIK
ncbi:MAG: hypothetical protein A2381_19525 [Bdellovibrionales bacterium RIFOXYB1_FULL_37_110]|nr:MAG: hypothetical protein A2417_11025 [Bdellovibrionales bacterium RIFOXYC1_FULL_37_79]OFZ60671.1 MAG: hypothetical protein A2381_19525 [Bdellovibrionales bacterium RIFOXYB1_FULL_37_110]OFZ64423.1 MAG: hypothetical protein A2577_10175 [Bdellovibrionales bacterium RIFOXYD1_FULL_36_51]